jgi:hypothetical protein
LAQKETAPVARLQHSSDWFRPRADTSIRAAAFTFAADGRHDISHGSPRRQRRPKSTPDYFFFFAFLAFFFAGAFFLAFFFAAIGMRQLL